jgi:hypothetical protein
MAAIDLPHAAVARNPVETIEITGSVKRVAPIEEFHLGGDEACFGMALEGREDFFQPARISLGVVVEQDDELALRGAQAGVVAACKAAILRQRDDLHFGIIPRQ